MIESDRIFEAISEALSTILRNPEDSIQDIFNECFESWEIKARMSNSSYQINRMPEGTE